MALVCDLCGEIHGPMADFDLSNSFTTMDLFHNNSLLNRAGLVGGYKP